MDRKKLKNAAAVALIVLGAALAVVGWFVLPETVITQISAGGEAATHMPKIAAIAIPTLLTVGLSVAALYENTSREDSKNVIKYLIVSAVGALLFAVMFFVNR